MVRAMSWCLGGPGGGGGDLVVGRGPGRQEGERRNLVGGTWWAGAGGLVVWSSSLLSLIGTGI